MSLPRMHGSGSWCRPVERAWGAAAGARELGCSLFELDAGGQAVPYHAHYANEEWLIVLEGALELRTPEGNREVPRVPWWPFRLSRSGSDRISVRGSRSRCSRSSWGRRWLATPVSSCGPCDRVSRDLPWCHTRRTRLAAYWAESTAGPGEPPGLGCARVSRARWYVLMIAESPRISAAGTRIRRIVWSVLGCVLLCLCLPAAQADAGPSWLVQPVPSALARRALNAPGSTDVELNGVSCTAAKTCEARRVRQRCRPGDARGTLERRMVDRPEHHRS
jgi:hypothetical protein